MGGIDIAIVEELRRATTRPLIVAGGIRSMDEVEQLDALGIDAVVGMALYTGLVSVPEMERRSSIAGSRHHLRLRRRDCRFGIATLASVSADVCRARVESLGAGLLRKFLGYSDREVFEVVARERGERCRPMI